MGHRYRYRELHVLLVDDYHDREEFIEEMGLGDDKEDCKGLKDVGERYNYRLIRSWN